MMGANLLKRGTLLIPSGPAHDPTRMHLYIICSDPDENFRQLVVPCCSIRSDLFDRTCRLEEHEHPYFRHPSYVDYQFAEIITHDRLVVGVEGETFHPRSDLNHQTFLRVTNGIPRSRATPARIKAFYSAGRDGRLIAA